MTSTEILPSQLFVAGEWRDGGAGTFTDVNPTTEEALVEVAAASAEDVNAAVAAARAQLSGEWASLPGSQRGQILARVADLIERDADILARLEALDIGKPIGQPTMLDVPNAVATFRHFAGWADKITGRSSPPLDIWAARRTRTPCVSRSA